MAATWTTEDPGEGSAAATGTMPAGLLAGLSVTSAGTSERGLGTAALTRLGMGALSPPAAFGESSGLIADCVSPAACLPGGEVAGFAGLPGAGLELLFFHLFVTSGEPPPTRGSRLRP